MSLGPVECDQDRLENNGAQLSLLHPFIHSFIHSRICTNARKKSHYVKIELITVLNNKGDERNSYGMIVIINNRCTVQ